MEILTMTKKYFCVARKWFDKINGNTYFNAKAIDENGKTVDTFIPQYCVTANAYGNGNAINSTVR